MVRCSIALVLAVVAVPVAGDAATVRISAAPARAGWFVCDGIDGPYAALFGARDATGTSIVTLLDRDAGRTTTGRLAVGVGDPGAGQVYYALSRGGVSVGNVHMVNPGMVGDPVLPAVTSVDLDGHHLECRFMPDTRFIGIAPTRSVMVRGNGGGLLYESFDYRSRGGATHPDGVHRSNVASLSIAGGTAGADGYRFTNRGVDYRVDGTGVVARRGGRTIARDGFVGWAAAAR